MGKRALSAGCYPLFSVRRLKSAGDNTTPCSTPSPAPPHYTTMGQQRLWYPHGTELSEIFAKRDCRYTEHTILNPGYNEIYSSKMSPYSDVPSYSLQLVEKKIRSTYKTATFLYHRLLCNGGYSVHNMGMVLRIYTASSTLRNSKAFLIFTCVYTNTPQ